jgi:teichuronic acid biosynthesis glycosyltransferase TuaC
VSVDVGDVRDVIAGIEGCHLVSSDPADIAFKLAQVLRAGRRSNGRAAAETISGPHVAQEVAAIYERLLRRASRAGVKQRSAAGPGSGLLNVQKEITVHES